MVESRHRAALDKSHAAQLRDPRWITDVPACRAVRAKTMCKRSAICIRRAETKKLCAHAAITNHVSANACIDRTVLS
eukprot:5140601-Prymnesium_polylepis.1